MPLPIAAMMPSLDGVTEWLNGRVPSKNMFNHPVLIQFWAISCPTCKSNMPHLQWLLEEYTPKGLSLISIHMPRMQADMNVEKVKAVVEEMGLTSPCGIDNTHVLGDRFQTGRVWPCCFLFDSHGHLRSRAAGIRGLRMAENSLKRMLGTESAMPAGATA